MEEAPNQFHNVFNNYLGLSYDSLRRILYLDMHLHRYKVLLNQEHGQRITYANWMIEQQAIDADFSNRIFSI